MSVELICPECGGVIGAKEIDSEGRSPCTCYTPEPSSSSSHDDPSDTVSIPAQAGSVAGATVERPAAAKLCITCGKDVTGHRRVKDSRGYLCYECAKKEIATEKEGTVPCGECGRRVKEAGLQNYNGVNICRKCLDDHKEADKKRVRKVATKEIDAYEKRNLYVMIGVAVVLGAIISWQLLKRFL